MRTSACCKREILDKSLQLVAVVLLDLEVLFEKITEFLKIDAFGFLDVDSGGSFLFGPGLALQLSAIIDRLVGDLC
uniref:Uncharacterized protein n=1 Tax=Rhizobium leguminosarum bv. trifolii TaxID=386 RepID=A0A1C9I4M0_RHILT|nr:hypothetical protein [Rhizobium leguminosarum bv. trifolii]